MKRVSVKYLVLAAIFIRLVISAVFFHGDLMFIWERSAQVYYPPLTYFLFWTMSPLLSLSRVLGFWILKLPYLAADLLMLRMLMGLTPPKARREMVWLWGFNPIVLYGIYAQGQMEIMLAALVVWSVVLVGRKNFIGAVLAVSAAAALKTQPIFLIPSLAIAMMNRSLRKLWLFLGLGISVPIISGLAYWLMTGSDVIASYFPSVAAPGIEFVLRPDMILTWMMLFLGLGVYFLLMWKLWVTRRPVTTDHYVSVMVAALSAMFIANPANLYHRYVLLVPILILFIVRQKLPSKIAWMLGALLFFGHIYTWPLQWGLVEHLWPEVVSFPTLRELTAGWIKYEHLALAFQALAKLLLFWVAVKSLQSLRFKNQEIGQSK